MTDKQTGHVIGMQGDGGQPAPKITFPCDYSLKIVGDSGDDFEATIFDVLEAHDDTFDRTQVSHQDSRNGRFRSLRVTIRAQSEAQLKTLFEALKATGKVHMVV